MPVHTKSTPNQTSDTQNTDPYRWPCLALTALFASTLPIVIGLVAMSQPTSHPQISAVSTNIDPSPQLTQAKLVASGREVFQNTCAVCHGKEGEGVPRIGKPLRNSAFVQGTPDNDLFMLIAQGRPVGDPLNTTGALMPPRGAVGLDDEQVHDVMAYLRNMQDASQPTVSVDAWNLSGQEGGGQVAIQLDSHPGYQLFIASCAACHGEGAEGMEGLGLPLTTSGFVRGETDDGLVKFIKSGRPSWDANNTTGIDMPPKGGNPAISDEQLHQIVQYLRALQEEALASN